MKFDKETVEYFSQSLRYNVNTYIDLYSVFITDYQSKIEKYFKIPEENPDSEAFDFLNSMIEESSKIDDLLKLNKRYFTKVNHWEFVCFLDEIRNNLETISNTAKWIGSSKTKNNWSSVSVQSEQTLKQRETLEDIMNDNFGGDIHNSWIQLSVRNNLMEKDYTVEGGNNVQITKDLSFSPNFNLKTVVDSLIGESTYGLDIDKKISFENNDIKVKSYRETIKQSVLILAGLKKGHIPEFPNFGIDRDLTVGNNVSKLIYSSIVRQLNSVFSTDDTLTDFNIDNIEYEETNLIIEFSVNTFFNKVVKTKIKL